MSIVMRKPVLVLMDNKGADQPAQSVQCLCCLLSKYEPRYEKTGLQGFRPGPTLTGLYNHRR